MPAPSPPPSKTPLIQSDVKPISCFDCIGCRPVCSAVLSVPRGVKMPPSPRGVAKIVDRYVTASSGSPPLVSR
eukprot:8969-Prymnesium_polylepis.1